MLLIFLEQLDILHICKCKTKPKCEIIFNLATLIKFSNVFVIVLLEKKQQSFILFVNDLRWLPTLFKKNEKT